MPSLAEQSPTPEIETPHKPVRPRTRRKAARIKAQKKPEKPEFLGLTKDDCCADCNMTRCVITGHALCGHPRKGGLQQPDMIKPDVLARYQRAAKAILVAEIEARK